MNIAILNAFGVTKGEKFVVIKAHGHDALTLKVKVFGGMSTRLHTCKKA